MSRIGLTQKQKNIVIKNCKNMTIKEMAKEFNMPKDKVANFVRNNFLSHKYENKLKNEENINFILQNHRKMTIEELAHHCGVTLRNIQVFCWRRNIKYLTQLPKSKTDELTEREKEVLKYMLLKDEKIADYLNIAITTVKTHRNNIYTKLRKSTRGEAIFKAIKQKIINLDEVIDD